jgi:CheY-like chemotaxis protein
LQLVGFQTKEAVNGEDAIAKFSEWNPNLVLMDMRMPVMDGYEATRRIKATEKGKQTPIVALTASTFEDELKQIDSLGIQGYIRKPFRENELFGIIGKLLGIKYIYDDQAPSLQLKYLNNENALAEDMAKLPNRLVLKMQQALAVADLDLMIELIKTMEQDNPELTQQLMSLAVNYDYDQLQQLLNKK